jgi:hypothetical protein
LPNIFEIGVLATWGTLIKPKHQIYFYKAAQLRKIRTWRRSSSSGHCLPDSKPAGKPNSDAANTRNADDQKKDYEAQNPADNSTRLPEISTKFSAFRPTTYA